MKKFIIFVFILCLMINNSIIAFASSLSYGVSAMGLDAYCEYLKGNDYNDDVTIAVVDSGIEDIDFLSGKLVQGYDFIDGDFIATDDESSNSHGTIIASIIADTTKTLPINIMPVRIVEDKNVIIEDLVLGIKYAVDNGADVINLSVGGAITDCTDIDSAIDYAYENDVIVVVSAGNEKRDVSDYCPAHNEKALTISAVDYETKFAKKFSNFGEYIDCCAPGVNVVGYNAHGTPETVSGTSFSAAYISAGVAMMKLENPEFCAEDVIKHLKSVCMDLGETGFDNYYGEGLPQFDKLRKPTIVISKVDDYVSYKSSVTLNAEVVNAPNGAEIHWFIDGVKVGTGESCVVENVKDDFDVRAYIIVEGKVIAESETQQICVKNGFFDKIIAVFMCIIDWILNVAESFNI